MPVHPDSSGVPTELVVFVCSALAVVAALAVARWLRLHERFDRVSSWVASASTAVGGVLCLAAMLGALGSSVFADTWVGVALCVGILGMLVVGAVFSARAWVRREGGRGGEPADETPALGHGERRRAA